MPVARGLEHTPAGRRASLVRRALITSDVFVLGLAYLVALPTGRPFQSDVGSRGWTVVVVVAAVYFLIATRSGLYTKDVRHPEHTTVAEFVPLFHAITATTWLCYLVSAAVAADLRAAPEAVFWIVALVALPAGRATTRAVIRRRPAFLQNTIIVGAGDVGQLVGRKLQQHPEFGIRLVGFVDPDPKIMRTDLDGLPVVGSVAAIGEVVTTHGIERAIVAFSNERHAELLELVRTLQSLDVQVDIVPRLFEAVGPAVDIHSVEGLALIGLPPAKMSRAARVAKRGFDLVAASLLVVILSPVILWIAFRVRRGSDGPILFRQPRLGEDRKQFDMFKFRTMAVGTDDAPHRDYVKQIMDSRVVPTATNLYKLERPDVVTEVGRWLRRTSLDELPQLFNVVRGDMSLVGPRPCMAYETELFAPHHFDRFLVPAGMTGLWQVSARASATFVEALDLDAAYARNWSFWLDLSLLARTPAALLRGKKATS
jgi:exopolysaccharide biosynthesis polyprenyl glycosylphosphotransferase